MLHPLQTAIHDIRRGETSKDVLGALVRGWRLAQGIRQLDLARHLGVSAAFLCDVELGRRNLGDAKLALLEKYLTGNCNGSKK